MMFASPATTSAASISLLGCLALGRAASLNVHNPGIVVLGEQWRLEWDSVGMAKFDIGLYKGGSCGGSKFQDLCGKATGCGDSTGDYNVVVPASVPAGKYSIKVNIHEDSGSSGCTGEFYASLNEPEGKDGSYLYVFAPTGGKVMAGIEFTAEWEYDDGTGITESRFYIDLYAEGCTGEMVAALCEQSLVGCKDSAGDYPVIIPTTVYTGSYSIKVGVFGAAAPHGCSPAFTVNSQTLGAIIDPEAMVDVASPWVGHLETKQPCDPSIAFDVRYSATTERIYFEHTDGKTGGCADLSMVLANRSESYGLIKGPLYPLNPITGEKLYDAKEVTGHWLVEADIYVTHGITLQLYGRSVGGDCDALRILSTDTKFYNLRGHGGNLDMMNTTVTSWDTAVNGVRQGGDYSLTTDDTLPRSYISCVSERLVSDTTCIGAALNEMGECRMDIVNSEIAYLGYHGTEAYGLTWKVRGFCNDKSNHDIFEMVATRGDVIHSNIHHNFYGLYTYGHDGGLWTHNKMHDNEWYGFDPHDDSDYLTIHNNEVWNNGRHGIIASKRCDHVSIQNNVVYTGGVLATGIFLHRSSDDAIVRGNYIHDMQDAGLAILESFRVEFTNNLVVGCKYGARMSLGSAHNLVSRNTFKSMTSYGFFTYIGSNSPNVNGNIYRPYSNTFTNNLLSTPVVCKIKEADDTVITGNTFENSVLVTFDNSAGSFYANNSFDSTLTTQEVKNGACFKAGSSLIPVCS